jgi:hypothetical protein
MCRLRSASGTPFGVSDEAWPVARTKVSDDERRGRRSGVEILTIERKTDGARARRRDATEARLSTASIR